MLTGDEIEPHHWDAFWVFYQDHRPRANGAHPISRGSFFEQAHAHLRHDMLLVLAKRDGRLYRGGSEFLSAKTRFLAAIGAAPKISPACILSCAIIKPSIFAIAQGLQRVEAGAQGAHKLARGYLPVATHSLHWFGDAGFSQAVARYLEAEREAVDDEINVLTSYGPFQKL